MNQDQIEFNKLLVSSGRKAQEILDKFWIDLFDDSVTECVFTKYNNMWVLFTEKWNKKYPMMKIDPVDFYRFAIDQKV